ncbi:MAG: CHAT domain-containing protein [Spirochaetes bacterium]|nr:CHAT domain-containing protein [Spirochaetota bacterium]
MRASLVVLATILTLAPLAAQTGRDASVIVLEILPGTPAAGAGLRKYDIVVRVNGKAFASEIEFKAAVALDGPYTLALSRAGFTASVRMTKRNGPLGFRYYTLDPDSEDFEMAPVVLASAEPDAAVRAMLYRQFRRTITETWLLDKLNGIRYADYGDRPDLNLLMVDILAEMAAFARSARAAAFALLVKSEALIDGMGDSSAAEGTYRAARDACLAIDERAWAAEALIGLSYTADERSDYAASRSRAEEALDLFRGLGDRAGTASSLRRLCEIALRTRDFARARALAEEALAKYTELGYDSHRALLIGILGDIALIEHDYGEARRRYEEALRAYVRAGSGAEYEASCNESLGDVALSEGRLEEARARFGEALAIFRREKDDSNALHEASCTDGLANTALAAGEYPEAEALYLEAAGLYRALRDFTLEAYVLSGAGDAARKQGHDREAFERYEEALAIAERCGNINAAASFAQTGASIAFELGEIDKGAALTGKAVDHAVALRGMAGFSTDRFRSMERSASTLKFLLLDCADCKPELALALWERLRGRSFLEGLAGAAALEASGVAPVDRAAWKAKSDAASSARVVLAEAAKGSGTRVGDAGLRALKETQEKAERELDDFEAELAVRNPRYGDLARPYLPSVNEAARTLRDGEVALVYLSSVTGSGLFSVTHSGEVRFFDLPEALGGTAGLIAAWREALVAKARGEPFKEKPDAIWTRLAPLLIPPSGAIPAGTMRVVIVPDGAFALAPFEAVDVGGKLLGDAYRLSYAPSLSVLVRLRSPARDWSDLKRLPLIAFGGAYYEKRGTASGIDHETPTTDLDPAGRADALAAIMDRGYREGAWSDLPGAELEAKTVIRFYYPDASDAAAAYFGGIWASESAVKGLDAGLRDPSGRVLRLRDARVLHFACHGQAVPAFPETSRIVLTQPDAIPPGELAAYDALVRAATGDRADGDRAGRVSGAPTGDRAGRTVDDGAGRTVDDGSLMAAEIVGLTLKADLVVLSACETADGMMTATEGVVGLVQSWTVAGANGVVASLWPVSDEGTRLFMTVFHRQLADGKPPADALNDTQRIVRTGQWKNAPWTACVPDIPAARDFSSPFYWAAFHYWGR